MSQAFKYFSVMLVDDNEIDNIINSKMIESAGLAEVTYTHNSASGAIDFLKNVVKLPQGDKDVIPAYIFLDIDMPMMDGFQFMDEFQKLDEKIREKTKIVMLTASMNPRDKNRAASHPNFLKYVNKPLKEEEIKDL